MPLFNDNLYTVDSTYVFNDGSYAKFETLGPKKYAVLKDGTTGAVIFEGPKSFTSSPKILIEELIATRYDTVLVSTGVVLELKEIIAPPPKPKPEFSSFIRMKGKVVDKNEEIPISNAKVEATIIVASGNSTSNVIFSQEFESQEEAENLGLLERQLTSNISSALIIDPIYTDESGDFILDLALQEEDGEIDFKNSYVNITKKEYFPKVVNKLQPTELITLPVGKFQTKNTIEGNNISVQVYNLGRLFLEPTIIDLKKEEQEIKIQIEEQERKIKAVRSFAQLPFEIKMSLVFDSAKERLKQTLIPAILTIIAAFGPAVVHGIVNRKFNALDDKVCPPKDQIIAALRKRNKLVKELNNTYKIVRRISKILNVTNALIFGIKIGLTVAQGVFNVPPAKFGYGPIIEKGFKATDKVLEKLGVGLTALGLVAASVGSLLGILIELLNSLDFLIQNCAEDEDIPFVELNKEFANLIDESSADKGLLGVIDPITGNPYPYKGFTFEIKQDTSQNFQYPKRYAIARNIQGIQVLRSESSFASGPEILIEELKFVIDRDNLRAD